MWLSQFPLTFRETQNEIPGFTAQLKTILVLIRTVVFVTIWEVDDPWEVIFKLGASAAASEFCDWVQIGIDVYIPHRKYQVKPHSYPRFSVACAAAIVYRNQFFRLYQQNKSSESKLSSDRLVIVAQGFLKLPNLYMLIKQESIISQKLDSQDFWCSQQR